MTSIAQHQERRCLSEPGKFWDAISFDPVRPCSSGLFRSWNGEYEPEPWNEAVQEFEGPARNKLLAALPDEEMARWMLSLEPVDLHRGQVLHEPGGPQTHVIFPTTALISLCVGSGADPSEDLALVGSEGVVGIALFMGGDTTPNQAVVQCAGAGYRLGAQAIRSEFGRSPAVLHLLLRYTQALITQMAQTVLCNRHHSVDQQLCRWLLLTLDRMQGHALEMTQEQIAQRLGVRREAVTDAARELRQAGVLRYGRGRIIVLDRPSLERRTCECYAVVSTEYARLLPGRTAT
jgi:CRP-like cAMP-binding protein